MNFKKPTQKQGNILMEINDNTSCLSFKVFVKTSSAPKEAVFRYSDEVQCENYFTVSHIFNASFYLKPSLIASPGNPTLTPSLSSSVDR